MNLDIYNLPFRNISDDQLSLLFNDFTDIAEPIFSFSVLDKIIFINFVHDSNVSDSHLQDVNPDTFIQNDLYLSNPDCQYTFPGNDLKNTLNNYDHNNTMSVISLNINSLPDHMEEFLDQCLPSLDLFDILGFTESKLSNDIQHLCSIPNFYCYCNNKSRKKVEWPSILKTSTLHLLDQNYGF